MLQSSIGPGVNAVSASIARAVGLLESVYALAPSKARTAVSLASGGTPVSQDELAALDRLQAALA